MSHSEEAGVWVRAQGVCKEISLGGSEYTELVSGPPLKLFTLDVSAQVHKKSLQRALSL